MIEPMFCMGRRGRPIDLRWAYSVSLGHYILAYEDDVYLGAFGLSREAQPRRWGLDEGWPTQIWIEIEKRSARSGVRNGFVASPIRDEQMCYISKRSLQAKRDDERRRAQDDCAVHVRRAARERRVDSDSICVLADSVYALADEIERGDYERLPEEDLPF